MPDRPSQDDLLRQLLNPDDDRAWKLAVGFMLGDLLADQRRVELRIQAIEKMYQMVIGGFGLLTLILLPLAGAFLREIL